MAESLHEGGRYEDPWGRGTGPSSWLTPPYPALVALCMSVFGGVTPAAFLALFVVQAFLSAVTCVLVVRLGRGLGLGHAALAAGWVFALYPPSVWNAATVVWDTTAVAFAFTWFLAALVERGLHGPIRAPSAARLGLGFGALVFLNPAPLAVAPVVLLYLAATREDWRGRLLCAGAFAGAGLAVCLPWMVRNRLVLDTFALRPNFGVELRLGNHPDAIGHPQPDRMHPSHVEEELARYVELGERRYSLDSARRAWAWIRAEPAAFAALTARRLAYFWLGDPPWLDRRTSSAAAGTDGNAWWKFLAFAPVGLGALAGMLASGFAARERLLVLGVALAFGAPYYVTHVSERYRFPLDPLLVVACSALVLALRARSRRRNST